MPTKDITGSVAIKTMLNASISPIFREGYEKQALLNSESEKRAYDDLASSVKMSSYG